MARTGGQRYGLVGLALALLVVLAGCGGAAPKARGSATVSKQPVNPLAHIHDITPESMPLFARVTFDPAISYDQALAILVAEPYPAIPYPWLCDDPRTPVPPTLAELRASFATTHAIYLASPTWDQVTRIASTDRVVTVDAAPLYMCP